MNQTKSFSHKMVSKSQRKFAHHFSLHSTSFKNKKAFSLVEMTIVVLVIGVLIVGIISSAGMIRGAVLDSARSFTAQSSVSQISGLVAWYETSLKNSIKSTEAYDGAQISSWYDINPSSLTKQQYNVTKGSPTGQTNTLSRTASSALTYKDKGINNIPSLYFNGSANLTLSAFDQGSLTQPTIFIVMRPNITSAIISDSTSSGSTASIGISTNSVNLNAGSAVSTGTSSNSAGFALGADYIIAAYLNGSSSKAYVNNCETSAGNGNINAGSNSLTGLTIGSSKSSGNYFTGLISEIIIFNHPLQLQERRDVFKYLSYKYKISVTGI